MAKIETVHRAVIFYDAPLSVINAVQDKAFDLAGSLDVETFSGCPAAGPTITAEGCSLQDLSMWVSKVERYIRRWKSAHLHTA